MVNKWKIIGIVVIVICTLSIVLGVVFYNKNCPDCDRQKDEKALLDINMYTWGINLYNPNEFLFQYWITNYGNAEAKNIKVRCKLGCYEEGVIFSSQHDYGNLASRSTEFWEVTPKKLVSKKYSPTREYSGYCYIESCDNCEILFHRVPNLVKFYFMDYYG